MNNGTCFFCGESGNIDGSGSKDQKYISCSNCGDHFMTGSLFEAFAHFKEQKENFYKVSSWICEQNKVFAKKPIITSNKLQEILDTKDKKVKEKFDLLMHFLSFNDSKKWSEEKAIVRCWFKDKKELYKHMKKAEKEGYVELSEVSLFNGKIIDGYKMTFDGLQYVEELGEPNQDSKNIFVAFNFQDELTRVFSTYVKDAIEELGFTCVIVNQESTSHDEKITDAIIAKLKSSRIVIADFTNHSSNVYFEAGFAMGMKIPVIWTCQSGHEFAFDTGQYPHLTWNDGEELKQKIIDRVQVII